MAWCIGHHPKAIGLRGRSGSKPRDVSHSNASASATAAARLARRSTRDERVSGCGTDTPLSFRDAMGVCAGVARVEPAGEADEDEADEAEAEGDAVEDPGCAGRSFILKLR
jgi:hypothetical protein